MPDTDSLSIGLLLQVANADDDGNKPAFDDPVEVGAVPDAGGSGGDEGGEVGEDEKKVGEGGDGAKEGGGDDKGKGKEVIGVKKEEDEVEIGSIKKDEVKEVSPSPISRSPFLSSHPLTRSPSFITDHRPHRKFSHSYRLHLGSYHLHHLDWTPLPPDSVPGRLHPQDP